MKILKLVTAFCVLSVAVVACADDRPIIDEDAEPEVISEGHEFTEGPYWHPEGFLIFSDIPADRVYRWHLEDGTDVYIEPSMNSNGIQADVDGNIIMAQHAGTVSRVQDDLEPEVFIDNYEGNRLNSPNDVAVHSNNAIFFTDPPFGVEDENRELDFSGVYRYSPDGELSVIYDEFNYPNGIVFSPDESRLYVNDSETGDIIVFDVDEAANVSNPREFASVEPMGDGGAADGMVTDTNGRLYTTGPAGLTVFEESGEHLRDIGFDQQITNLEWRLDDPSQLFITSLDLVYRLEFNVTGNKVR